MITQPPTTCQYGNGCKIPTEVKNLKNVATVQEAVIQAKEEKATELASELYWHQELRANPFLTELEKLIISSYYNYYISTPKRQDGSFYYSRQKINEQSGLNKVKQISRIHSLMCKHGLITVSQEKMKSGNGYNCYDRLSEKLLTDPKNIQLEDHSQWGGKRVSVHKDCGGECRERVCYTCTKCGEDHISGECVVHITEEELLNRASQEVSQPTMRDIEANELTDSLAEMPREINHSDMEAFQRAMETARSIPRKSKYALEKGHPLGITERIYGPQQSP